MIDKGTYLILEQHSFRMYTSYDNIYLIKGQEDSCLFIINAGIIAKKRDSYKYMIRTLELNLNLTKDDATVLLAGIYGGRIYKYNNVLIKENACPLESANSLNGLQKALVNKYIKECEGQIGTSSQYRISCYKIDVKPASKEEFHSLKYNIRVLEEQLGIKIDLTEKEIDSTAAII